MRRSFKPGDRAYVVFSSTEPRYKVVECEIIAPVANIRGVVDHYMVKSKDIFTNTISKKALFHTKERADKQCFILSLKNRA